jgi:hypothetical protein
MVHVIAVLDTRACAPAHPVDGGTKASSARTNYEQEKRFLPRRSNCTRFSVRDAHAPPVNTTGPEVNLTPGSISKEV